VGSWILVGGFSDKQQEGPGRIVEQLDLLDMASSATWTSGVGSVVWDDFSRKERGLAQLVDDQLLEDGSNERVLKTHPNFSPGGFIEATIVLPRPVEIGDRFLTHLGFYVDTPPCYVGDATFAVYAVFPSGSQHELIRTAEIAADRRVASYDIDLKSYTGADKLRLRVDAGASETCDWAAWWGTSISKVAEE
jgi:hypothetical protein